MTRDAVRIHRTLHKIIALHPILVASSIGKMRERLLAKLVLFDMYEGEFTHQGELCTFEVLVARFNLAADHSALIPIAEMIHDIDLKDGRFQRPETVGLSRMLEGLYARLGDDESRLSQGSAIFDSFFQSFSV
jgi:hypothetical protein